MFPDRSREQIFTRLSDRYAENIVGLAWFLPVRSDGPAYFDMSVVFGLIGQGLEPTIYHTRGKHANQYTTDAVFILCIIKMTDILPITMNKLFSIVIFLPTFLPLRASYHTLIKTQTSLICTFIFNITYTLN